MTIVLYNIEDAYYNKVMKTAELIQAATDHGIAAEIISGKVHIGGRNGVRAGNLVRLFASLGVDARKDEREATVEWLLSEHGRYLGSVLAIKSDLDAAFAFLGS